MNTVNISFVVYKSINISGTQSEDLSKSSTVHTSTTTLRTKDLSYYANRKKRHLLFLHISVYLMISIAIGLKLIGVSILYSECESDSSRLHSECMVEHGEANEILVALFLHPMVFDFYLIASSTQMFNFIFVRYTAWVIIWLSFIISTWLRLSGFQEFNISTVIIAPLLSVLILYEQQLKVKSVSPVRKNPEPISQTINTHLKKYMARKVEEIVNNLVHDINTPLQSLVVQMNVVESYSKLESNLDMDLSIEDMRLCTEMLQSLISRTQDFCKICRGTFLKPEMSRFCILSIVRKQVQKYTQFPIIVTAFVNDEPVDEDGRLYIMSDEAWIRDCVAFTVSNAVKFSVMRADKDDYSVTGSYNGASCKPGSSVNGSVAIESAGGAGGAVGATLSSNFKQPTQEVQTDLSSAVEKDVELANLDESYEGIQASDGKICPVQVMVSIESQTVTVRVLDNGIGMSVDGHRSLFKPLKTTASRKLVGGLGIGGYIMKKRITTLRGSCESQDRNQVDGLVGVLVKFSFPFLSDFTNVSNTNPSLEDHSEILKAFIVDSSEQLQEGVLARSFLAALPGDFTNFLSRRDSSRSSPRNLSRSNSSSPSVSFRRKSGNSGRQRLGSYAPLKILVVDDSSLILKALHK